MAHLLGSKACIDSLRVDVEDLQGIIHDVIGKTGSLKCHSWKFPDKLATDVDIKELLERYQYGKNDLDNQVSHVVLFEIIIDRLLLIVHGSWHFLYEAQNQLLPNTNDSSSTIHQQSSLSIGLVVKKYWNKLLHLFTLLQQHETNRKRVNPVASLARSKTSLTSEKQSQTIETTFGPCSSCTKFQECLHNYSENIINLCHIYNLPSSLAHYRCSTSTILSLNDINQWFDCQLKDLDRLSKHLEYLNTTLNQTKSDLDTSEKNYKQQTESNRQLQQVIQNEKESKIKLEELNKTKLLEMKKQYEQYQSNLNEQIKSITAEKNDIEQRLKEITEECNSRGEQIEKLEISKNELKILTEERVKSDELIKSLEQDRIRLQTELDVVKRDLEERNRDLQKDRMRIENMIRHEENSQSKQKTLNKSYEELVKDNESLKQKITELEIERDEIKKSVDNTKAQSLMETNNSVLQDVAFLKSNVEQLQKQIQQMNERERMLLQYPDLNGPIQKKSTSNNFLHDAQNQMQTNELRIDLLKKENDSLRASLEKFRHTNHHPPIITEEYHEPQENQSYFRYSATNETPAPKAKPTPLWLLNNEIIEQQQQQQQPVPAKTNNSNANVMPILSPQKNDRSRTTSSFRIHSADYLSTSESRPPTGNLSSQFLLNDRIVTIPSQSDQLILTGKNRLPPTNRPSTVENNRRDNSLPKSFRNSSSARTQRSSQRCPTCNKTFDDKRNYDIHKLYCRT